MFPSIKPSVLRRSLFVLPVLAVLLLFASFRTQITAWAAPHAQAPVAPGNSGAGAGLYASNYCVGCHTLGDERLANALDWAGPIERQVNTPCPGSQAVQEELYYTERLVLAIDRAYAPLAGSAQADRIYAGAQALEQTYSRLLDSTPAAPDAFSLEAFVSEAQSLRYRLNKSYTQLNTLESSLKSRRTLIVAIVVSLLVLASLGWGYYNTQKAISLAAKEPAPRRLNYKFVLIVLLVLILFALPLFKQFPAEVASSTELELARQETLDTAGRLAASSDRALARVWALAQIGAQWQVADAQASEQALADALIAARETQDNTFAIWGKAHAAQEITVGDLSTQQQAGLVAAELHAARDRAWGLRLAAGEWVAIDPARAAQILDQALAVAQSSTGIYRDLDLRAIAVAYASLDIQKSIDLAGQVSDPALRAWGLREIAAVAQQPGLYAQAAQSARLVADPVQRARSLREIAVRSQDTALFEQALEALEPVGGAAQAYALSDLAIASGNAALIERIPEAYPAARALAQYRLGQYEPAWQSAARIVDPFDRAHAQAAIAAAWQNAGAAAQIEIPVLRDRARRDITIASGSLSLADEIQLVYYKVQALTGLGQYQAAWQAAATLKDMLPLKQLALAWAASDLESARAIIAKLDREADKAQVLQAIAVQTGDAADFEAALGMSLAARVRNDALAPVRASLELGKAFLPLDQAKAQAAFEQAYQAALRIATK